MGQNKTARGDQINIKIFWSGANCRRRKLYIVQLGASWDSVSIVVSFVHLVLLHPLQVLHVLQDLDVCDVANLEDNVGVHLIIPGRYKSTDQSCLSAKRLHTGERDGFVTVVESVEDPLIPDLCL